MKPPMAIPATSPRTIANPTVPYDTLRYSLQIATSIDKTMAALPRPAR